MVFYSLADKRLYYGKEQDFSLQLLALDSQNQNHKIPELFSNLLDNLFTASENDGLSSKDIRMRSGRRVTRSSTKTIQKQIEKSSPVKDQSANDNISKSNIDTRNSISKSINETTLDNMENEIHITRETTTFEKLLPTSGIGNIPVQEEEEAIIEEEEAIIEEEEAIIEEGGDGQILGPISEDELVSDTTTKILPNVENHTPFTRRIKFGFYSLISVLTKINRFVLEGRIKDDINLESDIMNARSNVVGQEEQNFIMKNVSNVSKAFNRLFNSIDSIPGAIAFRTKRFSENIGLVERGPDTLQKYTSVVYVSNNDELSNNDKHFLVNANYYKGFSIARGKDGLDYITWPYRKEGQRLEFIRDFTNINDIDIFELAWQRYDGNIRIPQNFKTTKITNPGFIVKTLTRFSNLIMKARSAISNRLNNKYTNYVTQATFGLSFTETSGKFFRGLYKGIPLVFKTLVKSAPYIFMAMDIGTKIVDAYTTGDYISWMTDVPFIVRNIVNPILDWKFGKNIFTPILSFGVGGKYERKDIQNAVKSFAQFIAMSYIYRFLPTWMSYIDPILQGHDLWRDTYVLKSKYYTLREKIERAKEKMFEETIDFGENDSNLKNLERYSKSDPRLESLYENITNNMNDLKNTLEMCSFNDNMMDFNGDNQQINCLVNVSKSVQNYENAYKDVLQTYKDVSSKDMQNYLNNLSNVMDRNYRHLRSEHIDTFEIVTSRLDDIQSKYTNMAVTLSDLERLHNVVEEYNQLVDIDDNTYNEQIDNILKRLDNFKNSGNPIISGISENIEMFVEKNGILRQNLDNIEFNINDSDIDHRGFLSEMINSLQTNLKSKRQLESECQPDGLCPLSLNDVNRDIIQTQRKLEIFIKRSDISEYDRIIAKSMNDNIELSLDQNNQVNIARDLGQITVNVDGRLKTLSEMYPQVRDLQLALLNDEDNALSLQTKKIIELENEINRLKRQSDSGRTTQQESQRIRRLEDDINKLQDDKNKLEQDRNEKLKNIGRIESDLNQATKMLEEYRTKQIYLDEYGDYILFYKHSSTIENFNNFTDMIRDLKTNATEIPLVDKLNELKALNVPFIFRKRNDSTDLYTHMLGQDELSEINVGAIDSPNAALIDLFARCSIQLGELSKKGLGEEEEGTSGTSWKKLGLIGGAFGLGVYASDIAVILQTALGFTYSMAEIATFPL